MILMGVAAQPTLKIPGSFGRLRGDVGWVKSKRWPTEFRGEEMLSAIRPSPNLSPKRRGAFETDSSRTNNTQMTEHGRPPIFDERKQRELCLLVLAGCPIFLAAEYLSVSPRTVRYARNHNPEFDRSLSEAVAACEAVPLRYMNDSGRSSWRTAAWYLERVRARRFGGRHRRRRARTGRVSDKTVLRQLVPPFAAALRASLSDANQAVSATTARSTRKLCKPPARGSGNK